MALPLRISDSAHAPTPVRRRSFGDPLVQFTAVQMPRIEAALQRAVEPLALPLPETRDAMAEAVGLRGVRGHRWRPMLTIAAGMACGARADDLADVAAAVELTHTASLILDDLPCMDNTPLRRGVPATHVRLGSAGAILVAVGLLSRASELLAQSPVGGAALCRAWGAAVGLNGMSGGQVVDLAIADRHAVRGAARRLYRGKTTALSGLAVEAGGLAAGASPRQCAALRGFGEDLGWAYQLVDDQLDAAEDASRGMTGAGDSVRVRERLLGRATRRVRRERWEHPESAELLRLAAHAIIHPAAR